jgi:dephospho-CoA kinase
MKIIGLTGGMGSGKSIVARFLEYREIPVYDSDKEAKRIISDSPLIHKLLVEKFGEEIYVNEKLNKILLSYLLFHNEKNLKFANSVIHPEVKKDFIQWKAQFQAKPFTVIETAILFESGFDKDVDLVINIAAPRELRIERVQKRDKLTRESILYRMRNQLTEEERKKKADYTIINDNYQAILPQIENILSKLNY